MENKLSDIRKCIARVANVQGPLVHWPSVDVMGPGPVAGVRRMRRFKVLWQARNRRTRVMMARARRA
jgi:hypothetical protein